MSKSIRTLEKEGHSANGVATRRIAQATKGLGYWGAKDFLKPKKEAKAKK